MKEWDTALADVLDDESRDIYWVDLNPTKGLEIETDKLRLYVLVDKSKILGSRCSTIHFRASKAPFNDKRFLFE